MSLPPPPFPAHWGWTFTSQIHTSITPSTDPSTVSLPKPFIVLITGAGKGIGEHIAYAYAKAGASGIVVASRTLSNLETVSSNIKTINNSIKVLCATCDVTKERDVASLFTQTEAEFGRLDVLVNNAGTGPAYMHDPITGERRYPQGILEGSIEEFQSVFTLNFWGPYYLTRYFLPLLIGTKDGAKAVINVVSAAAQLNFSSLTPVCYNVSKSALARLTEHLESDYGEGKDGVVAFALHPGSTVTPLTQNSPPIWDTILVDDIDLGGGFCVWLTKERRPWLSGRYLSSNWDVDELEKKRDAIVKGNLLKSTMDVGPM